MSMVTGATSMSNNSAAAALAAAEEFRRAFNSHPLHTNPPSHHHSTTHSPLHQLPEDIPGLPRHRPNNSADFSPRSVHRPLHSYADRNEHLEVYHRGPTFLGQFVTKPVVTQGTNRCQMKDMNKIFPEIPYGLL